MASGYSTDCSSALLRMFPKIDMDEIKDIIEGTPILSADRKCFYSGILDKRYELILLRAYDRVLNNSFDHIALSRLGNASFKDKNEAVGEYNRALLEHKAICRTT